MQFELTLLLQSMQWLYRPLKDHKLEEELGWQEVRRQAAMQLQKVLPAHDNSA